MEKKDDYWRGVRKHRIRKESEKKVTKFERNGEKIKQKIGKSKGKEGAIIPPFSAVILSPVNKKIGY